MRGRVTQVMDVKPARGAGVKHYARKFIRVTFKLEDGSWAKTDVCPEFRNYRYWKPILRAGVDTVLVGLNYRDKSKSEINADSVAKIDRDQSWVIGDKQNKCKQCSGNGINGDGDTCKSCDGAGWLSDLPVDDDGEGEAQVSLFPDSKNENLNWNTNNGRNKGDYHGK